VRVEREKSAAEMRANAFGRAPFITSVELLVEKVPNAGAFPFNIPAVASMRGRLPLDPRATFFVGENGSGKSTLIEGLAVAAGFNAEGGSNNFSFSTRASESELHRYLRLARTERRPRTGFFLRAESFFNVATNIEALDREGGLGPPVIDSYGGRSLHEQSHGESFMTLLEQRFGPEGLYILDEPEAALSIGRQIEVLRKLHAHVTKKGSQIIVATHSPILMALPDALIYRLGADGITQVAYEDTDAFRLARDFLVEPTKAFD
jgi:predicted ATPase